MPRSSEIAACIACGGAGVRGRKTCSDACLASTEAARLAKMTQACRDRGKRYKCEHCGVLYKRTRGPKQRFCSRECAFAKKAAKAVAMQAHRDVAAWFLAWGDDVYPIIRRCIHCGDGFSNKDGEYEWHTCKQCRFVEETAACQYCDERVDIPRSKVRTGLSCRACRKMILSTHEKGNHRKRCRRAGVPYESVSREFILERDGWACGVCGCDLLRVFDKSSNGIVNPRSPTIDHIIPISAGPGVCPGHVPENLQACCWGCNVEKGARLDFSLDKTA